MKKQIISTLITIITLAISASAQNNNPVWQYPATKTVDAKDTYWEVTYTNFADQYAFVMWQCGHPDFQLKKDGLKQKP